MGKINFNHHVVIGTVTLERLAEVTVPHALTSHVDALKSAYADFAKAVEKAGGALAMRADGRSFVADADTALHESLEGLAVALIAARLSGRTKPLAPFGGKAQSTYAKMSRVRAAKEIGAVLAAITNADPPEAVRKAAQACARHCRAVNVAYAALGAQRVGFRKAAGERQKAYDAYAAAFANVRDVAKAAWRDDAETFAIVFGPIEEDRFGKKTHHAKKKEPEPPPAPAPASPSANASNGGAATGAPHA